MVVSAAQQLHISKSICLAQHISPAPPNPRGSWLMPLSGLRCDDGALQWQLLRQRHGPVIAAARHHCLVKAPMHLHHNQQPCRPCSTEAALKPIVRRTNKQAARQPGDHTDGGYRLQLPAATPQLHAYVRYHSLPACAEVASLCRRCQNAVCQHPTREPTQCCSSITLQPTE
jgi:hypothetical protein